MRESEVFIMENENVNESKELALLKAEGVTDAGTEIMTQTTIQDKKQVFNIENGECDIRLNDVVGQKITVVDVFQRRKDFSLRRFFVLNCMRRREFCRQMPMPCCSIKAY